ncbi:MAG TPA: serine hydrolase domain-containing protein [Actinomycetes bacterium]|nr:serine hydrolase domain-containing protein [Actinomycetes bacterium]
MTAVLLALTLVVTASPSQTAASGNWPSQAALLRMQVAMDAMVADGTPGMYVEIRQGSRVTELRSGRPNVNSERPWTDRSRFRVASVTKTFVAAVIMQLVGEGRMGLSDPVERWLPGQLPYGQQITIRQLLNHTSGVPAYGDLEFLAGRFDEPGRRFTPKELLARIDGKPLDFPPGTASNYVNTGYVLLALIAERVTGQPFAVALRRRILAPLGLTDTSFEVDRSFPAPRVHGYGTKPGTTGPVQDVTRINPSWAWGSGNLVSSSRDVTTFLRALMKGTVVRQPQLDQMRVVDPITIDETGAGFGLGLETLPYTCVNYGKNGSMPGYVTIAHSTADGRRQVLWAGNSADWLLRPVEPVLFFEVRAALGQLLCEGR